MSQTNSRHNSPKTERNKDPIENQIAHIRRIRDYTTDGSFLYQCTMCMKEFKTKSHCKYHAYCDTTLQKPFGCDLCDKRFITKSHADTHARGHIAKTQLRSRTCKIFDQRRESNSTKTKPNTAKSKLMKKSKSNVGGRRKPNAKKKNIFVGFSLKNRTDKNLFSCDGCNSTFASLYHLNRHKKSRYYLNGHVKKTQTHKGPAEPYMCLIPGCGRGAKAFATSYSLVRHMRNCHAVGLTPLSSSVTEELQNDDMPAHHKKIVDTPIELEIQIEYNTEGNGCEHSNPTAIFKVSPLETTGDSMLPKVANEKNEAGKPVALGSEMSATTSLLLDQEPLQFEISEYDTNNIINILNNVLSKDSDEELGLENGSYLPLEVEPKSTESTQLIEKGWSLDEASLDLLKNNNDDKQIEMTDSLGIADCSTQELGSESSSQQSAIEIENELAGHRIGAKESKNSTKGSPSELILSLLSEKPGADSRDSAMCQFTNTTNHSFENLTTADVPEKLSLLHHRDSGQDYGCDTKNGQGFRFLKDTQELDISQFFSAVESDTQTRRGTKSMINMRLSGAFSVLNPRNWWKREKKQRMTSNISSE